MTKAKKKEQPARTKLTAEARRTVALQDEVNRLTKELRKSIRENNDNDIIGQIVGRIADTPIKPPVWTKEAGERKRGKPAPEVPVVMWSDWRSERVQHDCCSEAHREAVRRYDQALP
jgi:hypothetical protein